MQWLILNIGEYLKVKKLYACVQFCKKLSQNGYAGLALGYFFLSPPLSPDIYFLCQIIKTGAKFGHFFAIFRNFVYSHVGFSMLTHFHMYLEICQLGKNNPVPIPAPLSPTGQLPKRIYDTRWTHCQYDPLGM